MHDPGLKSITTEYRPRTDGSEGFGSFVIAMYTYADMFFLYRKGTY